MIDCKKIFNNLFKKTAIERQGYVLLFLHPPKCGGSSIVSILKANCNNKKFLQIVSSVDEIEYFKGLSKQRRNSYNIISGHFPFGIHEYLDKPYKYMTILRNPIEKIISNYNYFQTHLDSFPHMKGVSLKEFADISNKFTYMNDNGFTRQISGAMKTIDFGNCDETLLDKAANNLKEYFFIVGILEEFKETLSLLEQKLDLHTIRNKMINVSKKVVDRKTISIDTIKMIEENNKLDIKLYELAKQLFSAQHG